MDASGNEGFHANARDEFGNTLLLVASAITSAQPRPHPIVPGMRLLGVQSADNYTFAFRGGHNHTTGQRFDFTSGTQLASRGFNGSFSASDALAGCEALCSSDPVSPTPLSSVDARRCTAGLEESQQQAWRNPNSRPGAKIRSLEPKWPLK